MTAGPPGDAPEFPRDQPATTAGIDILGTDAAAAALRSTLPPDMPKPVAARPRSLLVGLARFMPALACYAAAAAIVHPLTLVLMLAGNALVLTAVCAGIGYDMDGRFARSIARRGLTAFVMLALYGVFVGVLLAAPAWWMTHGPAFPASLAMSAAALVALLALWRLWPAFALPFVWDDAYPRDDGGSWLFASIRRSLAFARHLTGEHDLFFSHGLPAGLALLVLTLGPLAWSAFAAMLPLELRLSLLAGHALVVAPIACLVLATRCVNALLTTASADRRQAREPAAAHATGEAPPVRLPPGIGALELGTTLLAAARSGQVDLALAALERGADPNTLPMPGERDQRSALVHAVTLPDLRLLRGLIAKGVDVNDARGGLVALIAATRDSYQGRPDAVMTLLANGADTRVADADGNTALHHAALCGEPIVAALLLDAAAVVDVPNREGLTPLGVACANGNWAIAGFLLERGAKPQGERTQPAIHLAATIADDDPAGVKLLLRRKADVDALAALGRTPLMAAALAGHARIAEALIAGGAGVDLADQHGTTALMEAARSGCVDVIHALGKRKVDPDRVDAHGRSALVIACMSRLGNEDTVRALLALGADRSLAGGDGKRALDHAAAGGRWPIVALLDAAYPLPSNLSPVHSAGDAASAAHLIDALRFGHWNIAEDMRTAVRGWPAGERAQLLLGLVDADPAARDWLSNLGLAADARLGDGRTLFDTLVDGLPAGLAALDDLVRRGAPVGGAALVARVLSHAPAGGDPAAILALAADLVERGADVSGTLPGDVGALHLACALGGDALAATLLARGVDPNLRDARGRMPLHYAFKATHAAAVTRVLVRHGADPERAAASGETPLGLALARADRELVYWLNWPRWRLPRRALAATDLPLAAASGDLDALEKLLALGLPVDSCDAQGASALIRAAGSGYAALVVRLLEAGANPAHAAHSGATCLSAAVAARREAVVRTLLQHGVEADRRLPGGGTALMIAAALGLPAIVELLVEHGADANAADERGNTALQAAAQFAFASRDTATSAALLEALLVHGARATEINQAGQDALLLLLGARAEPGAECEAGHLGTLAGLLVRHGAATDVQDKRGVSPLHACAMHGLLGVARLLRAQGASIELRDGLGRTAGEVAALLGYVDVAAELGVARHAAVPSARMTLRKRVTD
ncbi:ankyrin repeat domain-containing protein [Dokdonella sp. MW10]|uniref:ankyrin repeat domain-containing protein n=1 Tax=Dokdonella sp. MW10 TaxID=2992926 RepID=UPI003F7E6C1A